MAASPVVKFQVLVSQEAQAQLDLRRLWWEEHRPAHPTLFQDEFDVVVAFLETTPWRARKPTH